MMRLTDLNPARDIGANSLLCEIGPFRLLIDCGLHPKQLGRAALPRLALLDGGPLDFIIVTHAHLDHGGALPVLLRQEREAPVLVSPATQVLLPRMLRNSCAVMMKQRDELGLAEYPLFTFREIEHLEGRLLPLQFNRPKIIEKDGEKLELTIFPAGHVAGAASLRIVHKKLRVFFTGDVLFADQLTLRGAQLPGEDFDVVVTETTRGRTARPAGVTRESESTRLIETIERALADGGSALVPVFALGRMQETFALLHAARRAGRLRPAPVFATGLGLDLVDYLDTLARADSAIRFRRRLVQELGVQPLRQDLVPGRDPGQRGIFVVSSGMLIENTPSYAVAASLLSRPQNAVCFVGYCDPDTPGGKLLAASAGEKFLFSALDHTATVRADVSRFDLSGHADREELLRYALARNARTVVLTHGDPPARDWFAAALAQAPHPPKIIDPVPGETFAVK